MDYSDIGKRSHDPISGKFAKKPEAKKVVSKTITIPADLIADIREMLKSGETMSSFAREAFVHYLDFLKSMK